MEEGGELPAWPGLLPIEDAGTCGNGKEEGLALFLLSVFPGGGMKI